MTPERPTFRWVAIPVFLIGAALAALSSHAFAPSHVSSPSTVLEEILEVVRNNYVEDLSEDEITELTHTGFHQMLKDLDRHSGFVPPVDVQGFEEDTEGYYVGIGVVLRSPQSEEEYPQIAAVVRKGPAATAGIESGDRIQRVAGEEVRGLSVSELSPKINGTPNTTVELGILRGDDDREMVFSVVRRRVEKSSVTSVRLYRDAEEKPVAGYVRLDQFQSHSAEEAEMAVGNLLRNGAPGIVFDLRDNGGGILEQAIRLAALFVPPGEIASTRGRHNIDKPEIFRTDVAGPFAKIPLIILIDAGSASASELVSASIRDRHRAVLVGSESYGKWTVQNVIAIGTSGRDGRVKITSKGFYPPRGSAIRRDEEGRRLGLIPDIPVASDRGILRALRNEWHSERMARVGSPLAVEAVPVPSYDGTEAETALVDAPLVRALGVLAQAGAYDKLIAEQKEQDAAATGTAASTTTTHGSGGGQ